MPTRAFYLTPGERYQKSYTVGLSFFRYAGSDMGMFSKTVTFMSGRTGPGRLNEGQLLCLSSWFLKTNNCQKCSLLTLFLFHLCIFVDIFSFDDSFFTNSAPLGRVGHRVVMSVCVSVCLSVPSRNTHFRRSCRPLVEDRVPNIGLG